MHTSNVLAINLTLTLLTICNIIILVDTVPVNVRAEQDGPDTVLVSWTPPPAAPAYQVQATVNNTTTTTDVNGTSHTISVNNQFGVYSITVRALYQHFTNEASAPVEVTVRSMSHKK